MSPQFTLRIIKALHTLAWAFFAGCILAIPIYAWQDRFGIALLLIGIVFVEVFLLFANGWRCPLTPIAAGYTDDRADNFDIYLPLWIARYNKQIFGSLFVVGLFYTLAGWQGWIH